MTETSTCAAAKVKPGGLQRSATMLIAAGLALGGCFSSRQPLIGPADGVKLFGDAGLAKRVSYASMGGGPLAEDVRFAWVGDSYVISDGRGRREPLSYRLTPLKGEWFITQRTEPGGVDYGLARRLGEQIYVYAAQCADLSDADRAGLGLRLGADGTCLLGSLTQLRATMTLVASRNPQPEGYYEVVAPTRP